MFWILSYQSSLDLEGTLSICLFLIIREAKLLEETHLMLVNPGGIQIFTQIWILKHPLI